jgi:hypothetical protein
MCQVIFATQQYIFEQRIFNFILPQYNNFPKFCDNLIIKCSNDSRYKFDYFKLPKGCAVNLLDKF